MTVNDLLKIIESLAWPITIISIVLVFKSDLKKLLGRISILKYKEFEAQFKETLEDLKLYKPSTQVVNVEGIKSEEKFGVPTVVISNPKMDQIKRILEYSPRSAILEAWLELEKSIIEIARAKNITGYRDTRDAVRVLTKKGFLPADLGITFNELRRLRNIVVHTADFEPSKDAILDYINFVAEMTDTLNELSNLYNEYKQ